MPILAINDNQLVANTPRTRRFAIMGTVLTDPAPTQATLGDVSMYPCQNIHVYPRKTACVMDKPRRGTVSSASIANRDQSKRVRVQPC